LRSFCYYLVLSISVQFILSCDSSVRRQTVKTSSDPAFFQKLIEVSFLDSSYTIAIPKNYQLLETSGEDFSVFYFSRIDTTVNAGYSGGIYFGNHPGEFEPKVDSCKMRTEFKQILAGSAQWKVFECDSSFSIQTIIDSQSGEEWNNQIHAFGKATSKKDVDQVFAIFSTLRKS
jgi:hypothetical protein